MTIDNMDDAVNGFNNYFVNVGPILAEKIPVSVRSDDKNYDFIDINPKSMFLTAVEESEIIEIVHKCKNKTSTDYNDIDMRIVKQVIQGIAKPLTHICNLSFKTGKFPRKMKIAKVIPLYKTGDKHHFTNYRPVSLLPQFSKILKKLFADRLNKFINKHNLLTDSQYGFRPNRSTSLAVIELIEKITNSLDQKNYAAGVFIDLKKAFDTINHDRLINKLERYGIRGVVLNWLRSYLHNRQQFVKLGEYTSSCLDIACGVPQGSVMGPIIFILYINDICKTSNILIFADDTNIFCTGEDLQQLLELITSEMSKLKRWFDNNKLSLNLSKTKIMLFGNCKLNNDVNVKIDGVNIERVYVNKFLGVTIDHKLCWKPHIKHVKSKLSRSISVLCKAKHILDHKSLHILYCSMILPYLNYCVEVWGTTYKSSLLPLVTLEKRAIRTINKAEYYDHTNLLFLHSRTIKFIDLVDYQVAQIMFKARNKLLPGNIHKLFFDREGGYNLREKLNFKMLAVRMTLKSQCISIGGVKLWNGMSTELKHCPNMIQFKNMYKAMIFKKVQG
uniref:Reverse transcriptase domain-containing protein n=1 Tax=Labrus bergylta TaxID=56723 RepID=A0A3Q3EUW8_9LABR